MHCCASRPRLHNTWHGPHTPTTGHTWEGVWGVCGAYRRQDQGTVGCVGTKKGVWVSLSRFVLTCIKARATHTNNLTDMGRGFWGWCVLRIQGYMGCGDRVQRGMFQFDSVYLSILVSNGWLDGLKGGAEGGGWFCFGFVLFSTLLRPCADFCVYQTMIRLQSELKISFLICWTMYKIAKHWFELH